MSNIKGTRGQVIIRCLIGSLILAAIFLLYSAYTQGRRPVMNPSPAVNTTAQTSKSPPVQFDFYTALPKMAVTAPPASTTTHWLQVGAFRQRSGADRVAGEMRNLGYHAVIQEYSDDQGAGYRVMLGPYTSAEALARDQEKLNRRHPHNP